MIIDIVVTSSNSDDFNPKQLIEQLSNWQFNISPLCTQRKSTDKDKINNLVDSLNSNSDVILAMRGGSGATRLMSQLKQLNGVDNPKLVVGYSDLTVLLNYLNKDPKLTCIHGPMAFELTTNERISKFANALKKQNVSFDKPAKWLTKGIIKGQVVGGNLMLVTDSIGTFYEPNFDNKILLLEEIDESIDKLDRMFAQLRDSNVFSTVNAIILGNFKNCTSDVQLQQLFEYYLKPLNIPVLYNLNLGHIDDSDYIYLNTDLTIDEHGIYY